MAIEVVLKGAQIRLAEERCGPGTRAAAVGENGADHRTRCEMVQLKVDAYGASVGIRPIERHIYIPASGAKRRGASRAGCAPHARTRGKWHFSTRHADRTEYSVSQNSGSISTNL